MISDFKSNMPLANADQFLRISQYGIDGSQKTNKFFND